MRLGTLLLRDAVITLTQLEQSLRAQVLSGGRLGTNLVELGFVDLNTLGRYLARVLDLPLAIADKFEKADRALIDLLGAEFADRHLAIPLGRERHDPGEVGVAMSNPTDARSITAIEERLQLRVQPYVTPELRLFYYLERYYGIRRRTRFTRGPKPDDEQSPPPSRRERRSTQPFRGRSTPAPVSIAPSKHRGPAPSAPPGPEPVMTFDETCATIDSAGQRNQIADAILRFTIGRFECAALFLVREHNAIGWQARASGLGESGLDRLNIPLGGSSIFQAAHDSGKPYRGPALSAGHPHEKALWDLFVLEHEPTDLHVVPLRVEDRIVNLLYAHSAPGREASKADAQALIALAERAENAYRRILLATTAN